MAETVLDFARLERDGFPVRRFAAGDKIFIQDEDADCMYVVRSGEVAITASGAVLENIGPNGMFGEMALMDGSARSATAVARTPTEVVVINEKAFLYLVEKHPGFALDLMRRMARRLRRMTESL